MKSMFFLWLMSVGTHSFALNRVQPIPPRAVSPLKSRGTSLHPLRPTGLTVSFDGEGFSGRKSLTPSAMLLIPRGGSVSSIPTLASGIDGTTLLALAASVLFLANGLLFGLAPSLGASLFGVDLEDDAFSRYLLGAIGAVAIGHGINILLASVSGLSPQRAIGFGLLARLTFLAKSFALNTYEKMNAKTGFMSVNTAVMSWTTFSLLTGAGNPFLAAKVFSTMSLLKAFMLLMTPTKGATKMFGLDASTENMVKPRTLCQILGEHLAVSGVLMEALAFGVEPLRAVGLSSVTWAVIRSYFLFVSKPYRDLGTGPLFGAIHLVFALLLSIGLLA